MPSIGLNNRLTTNPLGALVSCPNAAPANHGLVVANTRETSRPLLSQAPIACEASPFLAGFLLADKPLQTSSEPASANVEDRLQQLEQTVQQLTNSVDRVLRTILPESQRQRNGLRLLSFHRSHATEQICSDSELYIGPSHSFSFLKEAPANIEAISQPRSNATRQDAYSELSYISNSLTTAQINQKVGGDEMTFYIPSKAAGYRMISRKTSVPHFSRKPYD